jgi:hypothetical protein
MENVQVTPVLNVPNTPQEPRKKRVVIGIPGDTFTNKFLMSWTRTLNVLWTCGKYDIIIAPGVSSCVHFARMHTMGLSVLRGCDQKPFNDMDYDVWVTLDSDIVWTPEHIMELIDNTEIHPVVAAQYMMADMQHLAVVKDWDVDFFAEYGSFQFLTPQSVANWKQETGLKFMPVSYVGLGMFACRKEVLNSLQYPYFYTPLQEIKAKDGTILKDMAGEDVSFIKNIQNAGYTIMLNTDLRVGHEKRVVL